LKYYEKNFRFNNGGYNGFGNGFSNGFGGGFRRNPMEGFNGMNPAMGWNHQFYGQGFQQGPMFQGNVSAAPPIQAVPPAALGAAPAQPVQPVVQNPQPVPPQPRRQYACYGCGNPGHLLKHCPTLLAASQSK